MSSSPAHPTAGIPDIPELSSGGRYLVLLAAFLGWTGAGMEMNSIPARPAAVHFLSQQISAGQSPEDLKTTSEKIKPDEERVGFWVAWFNGAFLLGGAVGGLIFGSIGDRIGRAKTMGISILCYSTFAFASFFAQNVEQLVVLRALTGLGVGGMWPTGVALANEAWAGRNRGLVSGVIGTGANVGLTLMGLICGPTFIVGEWTMTIGRKVTPDDWRWVMLVGSTPIIVGLLTLWFVPESPAWRRKRFAEATPARISFSTVFRAPHRRATIIGILLGAVPLFGGWGCVNWAVTWADKLGATGSNAATQFMRSFGAIFGSFVGGWLAAMFGRRTTYFLICLGSFLVSGYLYWFSTPTDSMFLPWVFVAGLVATTAFGWLPLCLPELFPTEVRAAGSGVSFNFGRIITAIGVLSTGYMMGLAGGSYANVGRVTHWIFVVGMLTILFAPDTSQRRMDD